MKKRLIIIAISLVFSFSFIYASGTAEQGGTGSNNAGNAAEEIHAPDLETLEGTNAKPIDESVLACLAAKNSFESALSANDLAEAGNIYMAVSQRQDIDDFEKYPEIEKTVNQMKAEFESALSAYSFEVTSKPSVPVKGKAFNKPFAVKILHNGKPAAGTNVCVTYPAIASDGGKISAKKIIASNADGIVSFESPAYNATVNSVLTFSLDLDPALSELVNLPKAEIPFKVMTNMRASGGSIAIVDFSKADKPITTNSETSSAVLTALINRGFTSIGNCDFTTEVASGSDAKVQKAAQELFGGSVTYLVYGTIKYVTADKVDEGYKIVLKTDVKVRNVKLNRELVVCNFETTGVAKSEWAALNSCRKAIAEQIADSIMFGM